jgi:RNA polymerase sigma-70 factor (ECF subfamily)
MLVAEDLAILFNAHHSLVYRTACRITGNSADAEDVLQILFLRLLQGQSKTDLQPNPRAYLHRAAVNISLDIVRSRKTNVEVEDNTLVENRGIRASEAEEIVRKALSRLSPKLAELFVLRHIEGYDNGEIARMFGTSPGTIAVLLVRARTQLKEFLAGEAL